MMNELNCTASLVFPCYDVKHTVVDDGFQSAITTLDGMGEESKM